MCGKGWDDTVVAVVPRIPPVVQIQLDLCVGLILTRLSERRDRFSPARPRPQGAQTRYRAQPSSRPRRQPSWDSQRARPARLTT